MPKKLSKKKQLRQARHWANQIRWADRSKSKSNSPYKGKSFYRTTEWKRLRYDVLRECGARCMACGKSPQEHGITLNVDHIKPIKTHWHLRLEKSNLQVLCSDDNWGKGSRYEDDWRPKRADPSEEELERIRMLFDMDAPERI